MIDTNTLGWVILIFAWGGAFLTAQRTNTRRRYGFIMWVFSNLYFTYIGVTTHNTAMIVTFIGYQIANLMGIKNNWEYHVQKTKQ